MNTTMDATYKIDTDMSDPSSWGCYVPRNADRIVSAVKSISKEFGFTWLLESALRGHDWREAEEIEWFDLYCAHPTTREFSRAFRARLKKMFKS